MCARALGLAGGGSGRGERGHARRRVVAERGEDLALRLGQRGRVRDGAGRVGEGNEVQALELVLTAELSSTSARVTLPPTVVRQLHVADDIFTV
ncbi:MAG TPA: hypothetical protein VFF79_06410 [Conexibacter sp.]|nr:hypothetical protein [Conexibacter sp.]